MMPVSLPELSSRHHLRPRPNPGLPPLRSTRVLNQLRERLRLMHYSAWLARRWDDPAFPMSFPWFGSERYWGDQVLILREQMSALQVGEAEQALAQQQALRDQAADQLRRSEFRAPIAGRIISVDIKPGETVIAGTTNIIGSDLMTLADTSALLAELKSRKIITSVAADIMALVLLTAPGSRCPTDRSPR